MRKNSTSALKAVREESANRRNWVLWSTVVIKDKKQRSEQMGGPEHVHP